MYEKIFCSYKFLQPLVLEIFLWAMEKVCPEVLYEKNWSRASLSTTFFHTRLLEKLFPLPTKIFLTLGCKNYSNKIQFPICNENETETDKQTFCEGQRSEEITALSVIITNKVNKPT